MQITPVPGFSPHEIAVDASYDANGGRCGWAVVTGAGLVYYGARDDCPSSHGGELLGILHGLRSAPAHLPLSIYCDSIGAVESVQALRDGRDNGFWLPHKDRELLIQLVRRPSPFQVSWRRRNSDRLMSIADHYSRNARRAGSTDTAHPGHVTVIIEIDDRGQFHRRWVPYPDTATGAQP